ncbi:MAG: hypothetical protein FJ405_17915, partial [Verrucomicrobia bacterium]|nr:hypothetical protein [Verrucomicrobiota bacterium]
MTAPMLPGANRFRGRKRSLVAFTLVELMVVIGISMLLLSLAVPAFVRRLDNASIQKAVNEVLDICRGARAHAILRGSTAALRIQPATRTLQVVMLGTSRQTAGAAGDLVEEGAPVPGGSSEDGSPA